MVQEFKFSLKEYPVSAASKTYNGLLKSTFLAREGILAESYSIVKKENIYKSYGYDSYYLFKYSLKGLSKTKRVSFYYSLYGRGKFKGIIDEAEGIKFSQSIVLVPTDKSYLFSDFLDKQKIKYASFPILLPEGIKIANGI